MKKIILIIVITIAAACSKKTIPYKSANGNVIIDNNTGNSNPGENITPDTLSATNNNVSSFAFIVVTDAYGKILHQQESLPPEENIHFDALQLSKGFTERQRLNLKTRYKTIPPRVLYVNPKSRLSSVRGSYYILGKKFWYWKKKDGLFYLDEKYYL